MPSDPKPSKRIKDPELLAEYHRLGGTCALVGSNCVNGLSLHHIHKHPRDDLPANLAWLCGSGTTGHHGAIEGHNPLVKRRFGIYLLSHRQDFLDYLAEKLGGPVAAHEWLVRLGYVER